MFPTHSYHVGEACIYELDLVKSGAFHRVIPKPQHPAIVLHEAVSVRIEGGKPGGAR